MKFKTLKLFTVLFICTLLMMGFSCNGSINGYLLLMPPGGESTYASQDSWPCDTTSNPVMNICLFEETEGLIECTEVNFDDIPEELLTDDVPDTIAIYFGELPPGDYYLGIYCKESEAESMDYGSILTWYHSDLDSVGMIKEMEDSQEISISNSHRNIELGYILIQK